MKYAIRRLIVGAITAPLLAVIYMAGYIGLDVITNATAPDWSNLISNAVTLMIAWTFTVTFFAPAFHRYINE